MTKFLLKIAAFAAFAAGIYIIPVTFFSNFTLLDELPDSDLVPQLRRLVEQERYADAVQLGRDMKKCKWQYDEKLLDSLLRKAEEQEDHIAIKALKFARGFLTGSPDSAADVSGAIIADLVLYGDLRDLVIQGGYYLTGNASDPIITGSSSAGLIADAIPVASWFPAALKFLRKTDSFSPEFASHLQRSLKFFKGQGELAKKDRELILDLYKLISDTGIRRSLVIMPHIHTPEQLRRAVILAEHSPEQLHLTVRATGGRIFYSTYLASPWRLMRAGQKGVAGLETLQWRGVLLTAELVSAGPVGSFIRQQSRSSIAKQTLFYLAGVMLCLSGAVVKRLKKRTPPAV